MTYAAKTKVPVAQSKSEIERTIMRYGATSFVAGSSLTEGAMICFEMNERRVMFRTMMPENEQECRAKWRALLIEEIAQYLGHTSPAVTFRVYARYTPGHLRNAMKALG